jgi:hypothetical protein
MPEVTHTFEEYDDPRFDHEAHHIDALAREAAARNGVPLRDRYGFAAAPKDVAEALRIVRAEPDDDKAAQQIGMANALGDVQFCAGYDTPLDEDDERDLVAALRPIVEQRRDANVRSMEGR